MNNMDATNKRVPDWLLERYAQGDLDSAQRAEVARRIEEDASASARLMELERSDHALRGGLPPLRKIEERAGVRARGRDWKLPVLIPSLALAGLAAFVVVRGEDPTTRPNPVGEEIIGIKGDARLTLHRKSGASVGTLGPNSEARPGEVLQIGYTGVANPYAVILSIDGRGAVTLHHPQSATGSTALTGKGVLPFAYELDDAPGFERFVLITSKSPLAVDQVLSAARAIASDPSRARTARLPLAPDFTQSSLVLRKVTP